MYTIIINLGVLETYGLSLLLLQTSFHQSKHQTYIPSKLNCTIAATIMTGRSTRSSARKESGYYAEDDDEDFEPHTEVGKIAC